MEYTKSCGCKVIIPDDTLEHVEIVYCPKHKAAPELYETLKLIFEAQEIDGDRVVVRTVPSSADIMRMKQALAKAEDK